MPINRIKNFVSIIFLILSFINSSFGIDKNKIIYKDKVYSDNIKTVRLYLDDWELSYPVLELESDHFLTFSFDIVEANSDYYYYTIIHCNSDWTPSNQMFFEYADGFEENEIYNYEQSYNSFVSYIHYNLTIPNDDINLTKSGNYLLVVYRKENNEKQVVITKRFMLYEQVLNIDARVNASSDNLYRKSTQKIDFKILKQGLNISDPFREIKPVILQNYQWHNSITGIQPSFINNSEIVYEFEDKTIQFTASNEYRYFSFHNLEILSERIEQFDFRHPYYFIRLFADESNLFKSYSSTNKDENGKYVIRTRRMDAKDYDVIEADYCLIHFRLNYDVPVDNANVYLFGELSNYEIDDKYKLKYNLESRVYETVLLLKQGYYNYRYLLVHDSPNNKIDHGFFEGSHFETENDYQIFVYYREPGRNFDRLVAYKKINSRN